MKINETLILEKGGHVLGANADVLKMRVPFLVVGKKNENGRIYPREVGESAVKDFSRRLKSAAAFGSTEHRKDLQLDDVAFTIENAVMNGDTAFADILLLNTTKGRNIRAIISAGGQVGVSARGKGVVDKDGTVSDYRLEGLDLVLSPSFSELSAGRQHVYESAVISEVDEQQIHLAYAAACIAGYRGTYEQYKLIFVKAKEAADGKDK